MTPVLSPVHVSAQFALTTFGLTPAQLDLSSLSMDIGFKLALTEAGNVGSVPLSLPLSLPQAAAKVAELKGPAAMYESLPTNHPQVPPN